MRQHRDPHDSGWVGAGPEDDLDARLAAEEASEPFDRCRPHVLTALGPIEPAALGVGLVARAIVSRSAPGVSPGAGGEPFAAVAAMEDFYALGGRAVVVVADGADREALAWTAARAPIHLVAPPPSQREEGTPSGERAIPVGGDAQGGGEGGRGEAGFLLLDITLGAGASDAVIAHVVEAGATAHHDSGLPLVLHGGGNGAARAVARLSHEGVGRERITALDPDAGWREADLRAVLEAGAFAVIGADVEDAKRPQGAGATARIALLVRAGFGDRLLLGVGGPATAITAAGAPVFSDLLERFPLRLMEAGLGALAVRSLLVENLARAFTIVGRAGAGDGDGRG